MEIFASILMDHAARYPVMAPRDAVKLCYQAEFGGGHLITDAEASLARLGAESSALGSTGGPLFEPIGNGMARLHLGAIGTVPELRTVNAAFVYSAAAHKGTQPGLIARLRTLESVCAAGRMPFDAEALGAYLAQYRANRYPMVSHSDAYREAYNPAYRVVLSRFEALWPVLKGIDEVVAQKGRALVAIDGRCGAGKTTAGELLKAIYGANLYHMDDFFLRPVQRTPERYQEPGGNVDRERFGDEVWGPLRTGTAFSYRPFDCSTFELAAPVMVSPKTVEIVEGSYALHPDLRDAYDVKVFADIDRETQFARILERNGEAMHQRFIKEWIPMEERYFDACNIGPWCDFVVRMCQ